MLCEISSSLQVVTGRGGQSTRPEGAGMSQRRRRMGMCSAALAAAGVLVLPAVATASPSGSAIWAADGSTPVLPGHPDPHGGLPHGLRAGTLQAWGANNVGQL